MESTALPATGLPEPHVATSPSPPPQSSTSRAAAAVQKTTSTASATLASAAVETLQSPPLPLQQATSMSAVADARRHKMGDHDHDAAPAKQQQKKSAGHDYKGFVAGVGSGIAKLTVGHPFDTVKVRLQSSSRFSGPLQCLMQTVRNEGIRGLYKGATPPLVGWMFMDSVMLGSLSVYRRLLAQHLFHVDSWTPGAIPGTPNSILQTTDDSISQSKTPATSSSPPSAILSTLPPVGHGMAGILAGCTVSFIAAPVEHIKARLQIQYAARKSERLYSGPLDCLFKIYKHHGVRGVYHGLGSTLFFRSFFFFWWSSYDVLSRWLHTHTSLSNPAVNFWAGGLSAQVFWLTCYPSDLVKQRIMTDPLGGGLGDGQRKYHKWREAAVDVYRESGVKGYWRGFLPCFLRAFPANAMALLVFEGVMRTLP